MTLVHSRSALLTTVVMMDHGNGSALAVNLEGGLSIGDFEKEVARRSGNISIFGAAGLAGVNRWPSCLSKCALAIGG